MFNKVVSSDELRRIESFVKEDYYNCPYLYTNLKKYGINGKNTTLMEFKVNDSIQAVAFLYFDCLHLYYQKSFNNFEEIREMISKLQPRNIFCPSYPDVEFQTLEGYRGKKVMVMAPYGDTDIDASEVKTAKEKDLFSIAEFLYTQWPDIYDSAESIYEQMHERMTDNYGRTKYIERDGEIVATISTFAEIDDFAVHGGLLVSPSQRGEKLGSVMLKSIYEELEKEGKNGCGIIVEDYARLFHEKNSFKVVGSILKYNHIT